MRAIYKRELRSLFTSMAAYVFIAIYILIFSRYFIRYNLEGGATSISFAIIGCFWAYMLFSLLTMRSLPEERKEKIDQLLYTSPVSVGKIVLGKYLAMCTVWLCTCLILCSMPLVIKSFGKAILGTDYALLFVYFLLGCAFIAICMFISSLTESQLISAIVSLLVIFFISYGRNIANAFPTRAYFALIFFIVLAAILGLVASLLTNNSFFGFVVGFCLAICELIIYIVKSSMFEGAIQKLVFKLALPSYLESLYANHMLDLTVIVLYISLIALFLFFTVQTIQKRRYS